MTYKCYRKKINYNYQKLPNTVLYYEATLLGCPHCSQLTRLFSIVTPDCWLIQAQQCNFNMHNLQTQSWSVNVFLCGFVFCSVLRSGFGLLLYTILLRNELKENTFEMQCVPFVFSFWRNAFLSHLLQEPQGVSTPSSVHCLSPKSHHLLLFCRTVALCRSFSTSDSRNRFGIDASGGYLCYK